MNRVINVLTAMLIALSFQPTAFALRPDASTNLVPNASFDNLLSNWQSSASDQVAWVPNFGVPDAAGYIIGAAAVDAAGNANAYLSQCRTISGDNKYTFKFSSLNYCVNNASGQISFYSDTDCANEVGELLKISNSSVETWTQYTGVASAPAEANSSQIVLSNESACADVAFFDEIYFGEEIFSSSFD